MPEPFSWNVLVIGAWNLAILSPDGIRKRLFELPDNTPIELELVVDRPSQFRVGHEGLLVIPTPVSLEVTPRIPNSASLEKACDVCRRALKDLPQTPVSAAGVNIRYRFSEVPDRLYDLAKAQLDTTLSDADFEVSGAVTRRTLAYAPGVINVQIVYGKAEGTVEFNFHRDSAASEELGDWLAKVREFVKLSDRILDIMGVVDVGREIHV